MSTAKLHLPAVASPDYPNTLVEVDGHDMTKACRGVSFSAGVNHIAQLHLDLVIHKAIDVTGEFRIFLPMETEEALVALGWTPPTTAAVSASDEDGDAE